MPTQEELYKQIIERYFVDNPQEEDQSNTAAGLVSQNYIRPTISQNRYGLAGQLGDISGYANVGMGGLTPQAVNAGISGEMGSLDANIPLSNPTRFNIRGEMDLDTKRKVALALELTPMESAVYLGVNIPL